MSDENSASETDDTTEEMVAPDGDGNVLTRPWPAPKAEPNIMNPLAETDFQDVFTTSINQAFPTEKDLSPKSEAGPGDTAEDPIPAG